MKISPPTIPLNALSIRLAFIALLSIAAIGVSTARPADPATTRPNILILYADDLATKAIDVFSTDTAKTPNLNTLARDGVAFPRAYNQGAHGGAVCMASRAMLLTGRTLYNIEDNGRRIPKDHLMLGRHLASHGYKTYGIGKWHNSIDSFHRCFDDGDEIMFGGMVGSQFRVPLNHFRPDADYKGNVMPHGKSEEGIKMPELSDHYYEGRHASQIFADAAITYINEKRTSDPFFLYVAFTAPHDPRDATPEFLDMYSTETVTLPPNFMPEHPFDNGHTGRDEVLLGHPRNPEEVKKEIRDYYAIISHLDAEIGRIIDALKKSGQYENTIVIFTADNGLAVGQHGLLGKQSLYEHSIGVPLIWTGPGVPAGKVSHAHVLLSDIYPTLCNILDLEIPSSTDGQSFETSLTNPDHAHRENVYFGFRQFHRAISDRRFKLIEYNVNGTRTTQLFDLESDPWEMDNLAGDPAHATTVARLRKTLLKHKELSNDTGEFWNGVYIDTASE